MLVEIKHKYFCSTKFSTRKNCIKISQITNGLFFSLLVQKRGIEARMCIHSVEDNDRCSFMAQIACTFGIEYHPEIFAAQIAHSNWLYINAAPGRGLKSIFSNIKKKNFYGYMFSCYCFQARYSIDKNHSPTANSRTLNVYHQAQSTSLFKHCNQS
jgi:hypothetical protein